MFLKLILFFLLSAQNPLFVSLGCNCDVAIKLRESELRTHAFPFDWLLSLNHEKFLKLLNEDFTHFLDEEVFFYSPENHLILDNDYYELEFRHDWVENPQDPLKNQLASLAPKYERRIERFRELKSYEGHVYFLRTAYDVLNGGMQLWWRDDHQRITKDQAKSLKVALDAYFPKLDFTLVIINFKEEKLPKIELEGVLEFKIRRSHKHLDYALMLNKLK
jgi:hypothetical protein